MKFHTFSFALKVNLTLIFQKYKSVYEFLSYLISSRPLTEPVAKVTSHLHKVRQAYSFPHLHSVTL